jgi:signal transduction histidine kinase
LPKPKLTTAEEIMIQGTNDATLVRIEAQLVQNVLGAAHPKLVLQSGPVIFTASLATHSSDSRITGLQVGSLVQLDGVCSIQGGVNHEPESFRLLVAGSQNVLLLRSPPWWTLRYTIILAGSLVLGLFLAWGWNSSLRRRVKAQTEVIRRNEQELIAVSRQAGMAEVATAVLHNVGNVLNSVNVSATLVADGLRNSKVADVSLVADLMKQHAADLGNFVTQDSRGRHLPDYLARLGDHLIEKKRSILDELESLTTNIEHIKDIVAMQQSHATIGGVSEIVKIADLIEESLQMNADALERHQIQIVREFAAADPIEILIERHKVLQILVNIITNAKHACVESGRPDKRLTIRVANGDDRVKIAIADNGVGIPRENLTRIFTHGFTTRKTGHGFGLHSAALAAQELQGALLVQSEGAGKGATFILELPGTKQK